MSRTLLKLGPGDVGLRLSREEFANAEFQEPYIYERIQGRLAVMSPAGPEHRRVSRPFYRELCVHWNEHLDLVDAVDVEGWVAVGPKSDRIPDICVYLRGDSSHLDVPMRVPDLIFEFVSAEPADQERDYIDKRADYHKIGVKEYVIVDRLKQTVLVLAWQKGDFSERTLSPNDDYATELLPGLVVSLQDVFRTP